MENSWSKNTNYYIELNLGQLKQVLGEVFENIMSYNPRKDGQPWMLEHVMRHVKYLPANKVAISIQITNTKYADYSIPENGDMNIQDVDDYITSEDFDLAKYMFGVDEFMSQEEYDNLVEI